MHLATAYKGLAAFACDNDLPEAVRKPILIALDTLERTLKEERSQRIVVSSHVFDDMPTRDMQNDWAEDEPTTEPCLMEFSRC